MSSPTTESAARDRAPDPSDPEAAVLWLVLSMAVGTPRQAMGLLALRQAGTAAVPLTAGDLTALLRYARRGDRPSPNVDALRDEAARLAERGRRAGLQLIGWSHQAYPTRLRNLTDPPLVLWVSGDVRTLSATAVGVVGARSASAAALATAQVLGRELASFGLTVVSGLARGVDGASHLGALECGKTVAVLGSGLEVIYPPEHRSLFERVVRQGAAVSEFPPATHPLPHHFPRRNRIIAGLCLGVVVVEAGEKSGALTTAHAALEQGREVMVVPGVALAGRNRGGHALIKDGAALVEDARDVLDVLRSGSSRAEIDALLPSLEAARGRGLGTPAAHPGPTGERAASAAVQDGLGLPPRWRPGEELDLDDLKGLIGLDAGAVLSGLLEWELIGVIARTPSGRFVRLKR